MGNYGFGTKVGDHRLEPAPAGSFLVQILGFDSREVVNPGPRKGQHFQKIRYRVVAGKPDSATVAETFKPGNLYEHSIFKDTTGDGSLSNNDLLTFCCAAIAADKGLSQPIPRNQIAMEKKDRTDIHTDSVEEILDRKFLPKSYLKLQRVDKPQKNQTKTFPVHMWQPLSEDEQAAIDARRNKKPEGK